MKLYHNLILLLVIGLAAVNVSHADVYKYVFESESGTYSEISGGTVHGNTNNDDETFDNINLGFTFTFDGTDYTQVGISCNGFLKFGTGIGNDYFPISNILENDNFNLVSGLGWDLQAQTDAELRTQTIGSAPDRVFVCQWKNYRYYGSSGESYNFQIRLYEGSNRIEVKYGSFTVNQNEYWEVGIKGATDDDYANRSVVSGDNTWATSEAGDSKEDYCEMSSSLQPDDTYSCLVYSWELKPMSYESSEVTQRTGFARIGETDMALLRIQVDMLGTESPLSITELDFDLTGTTSVSDIANAKLYFTGADTEFNTDTQYGSTVVGPGGSFSVSGNQQLEMGENYFWLAIDISSNATEGNFIDAACTALTIGGSDYTPSNSSPTGDIQIFNSLSGDYDIGTGGNYATFAEVFEVCNAVGLSGNVRLNVVSNITETEQAYLESWDEYGGTGYSMTIRPDGGSRVISSNLDFVTFLLNGVSNFTVDGSLTSGGTSRDLEFAQSGSAAGGTGAFVLIGGSNIDFKNLVVHNGSSDIGFGLLLSGPSDVLIENCQIYKGFYGIYTQLDCEDIKITKNQIGSTTSSDKIGSRGIYMSFTDGFEISHNEIFGVYSSGTGSIQGININEGSYDGKISFNKIHSIESSSGGAYGLWIGLADAHPDIGYDCDIEVSNNMFWNIKSGTSYTIGMVISRLSNVHVYHNSIHMYGSGTTGAINAGIFYNPDVSDMIFKHNIIEMNLPATSPVAVFVNPSTNPFEDIDYNCYNVSTSGTNYIGYFGGFQSTLSDWKNALSDDPNSFVSDPVWMSDTDLHLNGTSVSNSDFMVDRITSVGTDFDGEIRRSVTYVGADEVIPTIGFSQGIDIFETPFCNDEMIELSVAAEITEYGDGVERSVTPSFDYTWYLNGEEIPDFSESTYVVDEATEDNEGWYQVEVEFNNATAWSDESFVEVQQPIVITQQPPPNADLCEGNSVLNIAVEAEGTILNYQWQQEDKNTPGTWNNIEGQNEPRLQMPIGSAEEGMGNYRVVVTGPGYCGPAIVASNATSVFVAKPLKNVHLSYEIAPGNVCLGDDIRLTAEAEGTILGYQWQIEQGGSYRDMDASLNPTVWDQTLVIENAQIYQSGKYRCLVFGSADCNTAEVATDPLDIRVWPLAAIDEQPESALLCLGDDILLSVIADGLVHKYQWQKDGKDLPLEEYPDANDPIIEISDASYENSGAYTCMLTVEDCRGIYDLVSDMAVVYVLRETEITKAPETVYSAIGGSVVFEVQAHTEGAPEAYKVDVQWYRGNFELQDDERIEGTKSSILTIKNVKDSDVGLDYRVVVTGKCGEAEAGGFGILNPGVEITQQPQDAEVCEGDNVSFGVSANPTGGTTDILYQWYMGTTELTDDTHFSGVNTPTLSISDVSIFDESDEFYCEFTIIPGYVAVESDRASLDVKEFPRIVDQSMDMSVETGKTLDLFVVAEGDAPLEYQWYKDGAELTGETSSTMSRANIDAADAGEYVCRISNDCGYADTQPVVVTVTKQNISGVADEIPEILSLGVNEPNPFAQETSIRFSLMETAKAELTVSDMSGRKIATLVSGTLPAGEYNAKFNASEYDLPAGVYYYTLKSANGSITRSMVVVR